MYIIFDCMSCRLTLLRAFASNPQTSVRDEKHKTIGTFVPFFRGIGAPRALFTRALGTLCVTQ